jgi:hypothetical protein
MTHRQIDRHLRGERPRDYRLHQCLGNNALGTALTADFDVEAKRLRRAAEAGLRHLIKSKRCRSHTTSRMGTRLPRVRARRSRRLGDQALAGEYDQSHWRWSTWWFRLRSRRHAQRRSAASRNRSTHS